MRITFLILFLLMAISGLSQNQTYENLIFEGAGIRGIAYSGVIKQMEEQGIMGNIKKVGGTSAGAITALMVSLGYTSDEIYNLISETKFQKFNDGNYIFFGGFARLKKRYVWYRGDEFTHWIEKVIEAKTGHADITLKQLEERNFKQLYVTATCIKNQKLLILSAETYPSMKVKDAVRISMSVPLYFEAVFIDKDGTVYKKPKNTKDLDIVVDGGIIGNYPIFIFDDTYIDASGNSIRKPNPKTLGVRIDSDAQIAEDLKEKQLASLQIENVKDYIEAFYILVLENLNRNQLTNEDWNRTISVSSVGIGPKVKRLSKAQKMELIKSGESHTVAFFNNIKQ